VCLFPLINPGNDKNTLFSLAYTSACQPGYLQTEREYRLVFFKLVKNGSEGEGEETIACVFDGRLGFALDADFVVTAGRPGRINRP
jgi:hypothetical protein